MLSKSQWILLAELAIGGLIILTVIKYGWPIASWYPR